METFTRVDPMILSSYVTRFSSHFLTKRKTKKHLSRGTWDITAFLLRRRRRQEEASVWSKGGEEVSSSLLLFRRCSSSSSSFILGNHPHRFRP